MKLNLPAISVNEGVARAIVGAFCSQLDPTIEEIADIKCSVSEAVTNCIVHGYLNCGGIIYITATIYSDRSIKIDVRDRGCGIEDVEMARTPLFTTDTTGERSGMGFSGMESFMGGVRVYSKIGSGTRVSMTKKLSERA
ncbi:MAG: anti-sigma F factor [Clostridia bacterium]|nr:anti-sigma F factor [Clostridia bacterium]